MHLLGVDGRKHGVVDFRGVVQDWVANSSKHNPGAFEGGASVARGPPSEQGCLQVPRFASLQNHLAMRNWPFSAASSSSSVAASRTGLGLAGALLGTGRSNGQDEGKTQPQLVQGNIELDDADPSGGSSRKNHEFVQSIRTHPTLKNRVGVLLTLTQGEQSYIALVDLDNRALGA